MQIAKGQETGKMPPANQLCAFLVSKKLALARPEIADLRGDMVSRGGLQIPDRAQEVHFGPDARREGAPYWWYGATEQRRR